jgi:ribosomal protein S1
MTIKTGTGTNLGFESEEKINSPFYSVYSEYEILYPSKTIELDSILEGQLVSKNEKYAYFDCGLKSEITVQLDQLEKTIIDNLEVGSKTKLIITSLLDRKEYTIFGSVHKIKMIEVESVLENAYINKTVMTGIPTEYNHAGYTILVNVNDETIALFMPHLLTDVNKLPDAESIISEEINFLLEKSQNGSYLASRKSYLQQEAKREIKSIIKGNYVYEGFVTGTTDYAVYVQFNGCLTAMLHKSNLTEYAQDLFNKGQIVKGQTIQFYVKDIIKEKHNTKLFVTQVLRDSLWDTIQVNDVLSGTISSIKDFGLLIDLDYETKGLLHESILNKPVNAYKLGESVSVKVSQINKSKRQITLALA